MADLALEEITSLLALPSSYTLLSDWADPIYELQTADHFHTLSRACTIAVEPTSRDAYLNASLEEKLDMHALINKHAVKQGDERRLVTRKELDALERRFNVAKVEREVFAKGVFGLQPVLVGEMLLEAKRSERVVERGRKERRGSRMTGECKEGRLRDLEGGNEAGESVAVEDVCMLENTNAEIQLDSLPVAFQDTIVENGLNAVNDKHIRMKKATHETTVTGADSSTSGTKTRKRKREPLGVGSLGHVDLAQCLNMNLRGPGKLDRNLPGKGSRKRRKRGHGSVTLVNELPMSEVSRSEICFYGEGVLGRRNKRTRRRRKPEMKCLLAVPPNDPETQETVERNDPNKPSKGRRRKRKQSDILNTASMGAEQRNAVDGRIRVSEDDSTISRRRRRTSHKHSLVTQCEEKQISVLKRKKNLEKKRGSKRVSYINDANENESLSNGRKAPVESADPSGENTTSAVKDTSVNHSVEDMEEAHKATADPKEYSHLEHLTRQLSPELRRPGMVWGLLYNTEPPEKDPRLANDENRRIWEVFCQYGRKMRPRHEMALLKRRSEELSLVGFVREIEDGTLDQYLRLYRKKIGLKDYEGGAAAFVKCGKVSGSAEDVRVHVASEICGIPSGKVCRDSQSSWSQDCEGGLADDNETPRGENDDKNTTDEEQDIQSDPLPQDTAGHTLTEAIEATVSDLENDTKENFLGKVAGNEHAICFPEDVEDTEVEPEQHSALIDGMDNCTTKAEPSHSCVTLEEVPLAEERTNLSNLNNSTQSVSTSTDQLSPIPPSIQPTIKEEKLAKTHTPSHRKPTLKTSPYFTPTTTKHRHPAGTHSCIPFPPTTSSTFGLIQEKLADSPFALLIAVTFLNKTRGTVAIPTFHKLMAQYPTPLALSQARPYDVVDMIRHLGFQNMRAAKLINLAKAWLDTPPVKGVRYRTLNYPFKGAGRGIKPNVPIGDEDPREGAWEVAHLPGCGDYAIDSWRIFCRDGLRGVAGDWDGEASERSELSDTSELSDKSESIEKSDLSDKSELNDQNDKEEPDDINEEEKGFPDPDFMPEWTRVLPLDKELRAFLRWRWLKEGFEWDPLSGRRSAASREMMRAGRLGSGSWQEQRDVVRGRGVVAGVVSGEFVAGSEEEEDGGVDGVAEGDVAEEGDGEFLLGIGLKRQVSFRKDVREDGEDVGLFEGANRRRSGRIQIKACASVAVQA